MSDFQTVPARSHVRYTLEPLEGPYSASERVLDPVGDGQPYRIVSEEVIWPEAPAVLAVVEEPDERVPGRWVRRRVPAVRGRQDPLAAPHSERSTQSCVYTSTDGRILHPGDQAEGAPGRVLDWEGAAIVPLALVERLRALVIGDGRVPVADVMAAARDLIEEHDALRQR
uniref:Uncharacterized protein n=1 Tax=Dulem virus 38 TaxID=3145756 RepID=A0AAU8B1K6_9CAUD